MLKKFISYYKPHKFMFSLDMLASLMIAVIGLGYPIITRKMLNDWIPNVNIKFIIMFGIILLLLYVIRMLLKYFVQYYGHMIGIKMQAQMRIDLFTKLQKLPYSYYDNHETGKIMTRMTNDLQDVSELAHHGPENIFICGIMIIGSFIYLCTIEYHLTLIIFACIPILVIISIILKKRMRHAFMESRKSVAIINGAIESSISGIRVTKAFTNSKKELEKFNEGNNMYVEARRKSYKAMGQFNSSTSFVTDIFNVIVLIAGGIFLAKGDITFGDYSTFIVSVNLFISPITTLITFVEQLEEGSTGFKRFMEILDEKEEVENENSKPLKVTNGEILFEHVSFKYNDSKEVLNDINLHIAGGKKLALVGPSGGGKTTICHLLPRFYLNEEGSIYIDNQNINNVTLESLRKNIGIVQQDVFLFNGSIKDNILYGNLNASNEEVVEAAKRANIHDYITSLPKGYDTQIGERGVKLSGGQKQRLSIARVFLKNPSILILDEATSALDNTTEILIQNALDELCKGRTTLVVAHRLSTIKTADEIVVINNGRIKEQGTHEELLAINGIYAHLYNLQFRTSEIEYLNQELSDGEVDG
ncbi:MAG: ABC transporter ATP-binding protein/permease [Acholeplasmataceae bacterium]|nr:ABC transporter ATP-binding protein/permease [Acholeplasmataceae bacterium]